MHDLVHVISSKDDGAHKARGYNRGRGARRSNAFDVAPEGAEAAPRSFKGYTLGSYAPNNLAVNPPPILPTSPQTPPRGRFRALGSFSLFDEIELRAAASFDRHPSITNADNQTMTDEDGTALCGIAVFGPLSPLLGAVTLRHMGWSSILLDSTLLGWRLIMFAVALGTAITAGVQSIPRGAYFLPFYATIGAMVCARLLALSAKYRAQRADFEAVNTPRKYFAIDAFMYQSMVTLQCFAVVVYMASFSVPIFGTLVRAVPKFDASFILSVVFVTCCIFDIGITPIPFRLLYVFPAAFYSGALAALALRRVPDRNLAIAALLGAFGTTIVVGIVVTIYARVVYIIIHHGRMLFALKANTPSQVLRDVNSPNQTNTNNNRNESNVDSGDAPADNAV